MRKNIGLVILAALPLVVLYARPARAKVAS